MSEHAPLPPPTVTNPRGIPQAPFIDKVENYATSSAQVESLLKSFQEMMQKYKFMEMNRISRIQGLNAKIPEIEKTLETVRFLDQRNASDSDSEPLTTHYELDDTLYAKAVIEKSDTVYLWLGANVMLEYSIPDALDLLQSKLTTAKTSLATCTEDLEYLRENITTMEVNTARVHNWDVQRRRDEKAGAEA